MKTGLLIICVFFSLPIVAQRKLDTVPVFMLCTDTSYNHGLSPYKLAVVCDGFSVREWHNEAEGHIDWYHSNRRAPQDYPVHIKYLDEKKKPLVKEVVWQSVPRSTPLSNSD